MEKEILKKVSVDSIDQCNNHVRTCGSGGSLDETYIYSKGKPVDECLLELHEKTEALFRESLDYPWFVPVNIGTSTIDAAIFTQNAQDIKADSYPVSLDAVVWQR